MDWLSLKPDMFHVSKRALADYRMTILPHLSKTAVSERRERVKNCECILNISVKLVALLDTEIHIEKTHFKEATDLPFVKKIH